MGSQSPIRSKILRLSTGCGGPGFRRPLLLLRSPRLDLPRSPLSFGELSLRLGGGERSRRLLSRSRSPYLSRSLSSELRASGDRDRLFRRWLYAGLDGTSCEFAAPRTLKPELSAVRDGVVGLRDGWVSVRSERGGGLTRAARGPVGMGLFAPTSDGERVADEEEAPLPLTAVEGRAAAEDDAAGAGLPTVINASCTWASSDLLEIRQCPNTTNDYVRQVRDGLVRFYEPAR